MMLVSPEAPPLLPVSVMFHLLPAGFGEHNHGAGAAFKGGLDGTHSDRIRRVPGHESGASQLLKQLSVEHGCLCLTGDLTEPVGEGREGLYTIIPTTIHTHRERERTIERHGLECLHQSCPVLVHCDFSPDV